MTAAREKLRRLTCCPSYGGKCPRHEVKLGCWATFEKADAIISAFPHLGAPTEDVVEAAAAIALKHHANSKSTLADDIVALVTAHAAREREAILQIALQYRAYLDGADCIIQAIRARP